jgi:xylulokinase
MQGTRYILGIDLGTSCCKVVLVTAAGRPHHSGVAGYPTASPAAGWTEQHPADWLAAVREAVRQLLAEARVAESAIAGLALTSAAHIGVLLDGHGAVVRPAILWNDQRSAAEVAELEALAGAEILAASCQAVSTGWTLAHLVWVRRHEPQAWQRVRAIRLSKDFLLEWLTGRAVTDPATAVSAQLCEAARGAWSPRLCELAGVRPDMLPEIRPAIAEVGGLTREAAAALGLRPGTPVINGSLDSATEMLAAGALRPGDGLLRLATAGGLQVVVPGPQPDRRRITYPHIEAPFWYCQAGTSTCAAAVQWAVGALAGEPDAGAYAAWDALAARVPAGSDGVLFHPYLAGERAPHWDPHLRGSFTGLALRHGRGHLARAVYEGTAFSIRQALSVLPELRLGTAAALPVVGGGARSALWLEILASVLGQPLRPLPGADSAYGAALLGLVGCGLTGGALKAASENPAGAGPVVPPAPEAGDLYAARFAEYIDLHRRLAPFYAGRENTTLRTG